MALKGKLHNFVSEHKDGADVDKQTSPAEPSDSQNHSY